MKSMANEKTGIENLAIGVRFYSRWCGYEGGSLVPWGGHKNARGTGTQSENFKLRFCDRCSDREIFRRQWGSSSPYDPIV